MAQRKVGSILKTPSSFVVDFKLPDGDRILKSFKKLFLNLVVKQGSCLLLKNFTIKL